MNTELRLDHNIASSNKHGKSAKDNRITDLEKNWTWQKTASGSNIQSTKSTCYRKLTWQNKACQCYTKCIWQKSLTDHKPKMTRRYDGKHVNIASFIIRFQSNAWQTKHTYSKMAYLWNYPWQEQKHSMYGSTTTSLAKVQIMLRICQKYFIAKVEQDWVMLWHSIIANKGSNGSITTISTKHPYWTSPKYAWISL